MRSKENCVDSAKVMELAFQNILDEIIEHVIEGFCFEVHRAVKLDYFAVNEYIVQERKFEICDDKSISSSDSNGYIFENQKKIGQFSFCPQCKQKKATQSMIRHLNKCNKTSKPNGSSNSENGGKREYYENNVEDEDNSNGNDNYDRKKVNHAKKQAKSAPNYDTMTPQQKHDFLLKHCGVVTKRTKKPCSNSVICKMHSHQAREEVRTSIFESLADHSADGIDIDTVD